MRKIKTKNKEISDLKKDNAKTPAEALKNIQDTLKKFAPEGVSLSDELISDRRKEAEME